MRLSRYFMPTLKEDPKEAQIASHRLMLRAGMIQQSSAGIYSWLPLGNRVLKNIERIVREEQDRAGALEILMPTIQPADLWRESGRYDDYGKEMLRIVDRHDRDMLYGPTNEEQVTDIFRSHVNSYKDLPLNLYHIQWKFRDEVRPRFGVMRGREFLMKDAYSFDLDYEGAKIAYNTMFVAYLKTYARLGLQAIPLRADTGPIGGDLSHEFIILADTGESEVFYHKDILNLKTPEGDHTPEELQALVDEWTSYYAAADEMHDADNCGVAEGDLVARRGIEVGHIFHFGEKYSKAMGATVMGPDGKEITVSMGSYGIGVSRLVGGIIEACHDEAGIVWPEEVAPFKVGLINLKSGDEACDAACEDFYAKLQAAGIEVLYDDTSDRAGGKFAKMDLIGVPYQVTIGPRGLKTGVVEFKTRKSGEKEEITPEAALNRLVG
ncbi:proline--tRNA ligase [Sneathiella chinensis]|uniref:Proline--tRNA ligase n=1 Tax=Sneathiella chinensis TaxID=349750 RepID=A0ABQ5U5Y3_9PROT|nr:proline--tRNA ligase [Sneathiella chinensis]GLQ07186.1 proline--tRNA ligase [Sneathiella chinensis]